MSTSIDADFPQLNHPHGELRIVLHNVRWETYEGLLSDLASQSSPRLSYYKGVLEIMAPLPAHERLIYIIEMIVSMVALHTDTNFCCLRSTTFRREDLERGFEADTCFYVRNEPQIRGKDSIDLRKDPPPDLIVEIDITSGSMNKFPIYAQLQIPEVWRHDGNNLEIYQLSGQSYTTSRQSVAFPFIYAIEASDFIRQSKTLTTFEFLKSLPEWIGVILSRR